MLPIRVELYSQVAKYDDSVTIERTRGEVSARCDMEAANFIALNLMHDIVTGKHNAEEARKAYGEIASAYLMNRPPPYAEALQFTVTEEDTKDRDETKIAGAMLHQTAEKIKDVVQERTKVKIRTFAEHFKEIHVQECEERKVL